MSDNFNYISSLQSNRIWLQLQLLAFGRRRLRLLAEKIVCAVRVLHFQSFVNWIYSSVLALCDLAISFDFYFYFIWQFLIAPRYSWLWRQLSEIVLETMWVSDFCRPRRTLEIIEIVLPFGDGIRRHSRVPSIEVLVFGCNPSTLSVCSPLSWNFLVLSDSGNLCGFWLLISKCQGVWASS